MAGPSCLMLAEFALTPSIFDESAQADAEEWRDQLRELGAAMFPRTGAWPVMISNLYSGSWENVANKVMKSVQDPKARELCAGLLTNSSKAFVSRPACGDWPGEESILWAKEALASHSDFPIDRIIGCKAIYDILRAEHRSIRCIKEVQDSGFWKGVESSWSQSMRISDQVDALRKICVHASFICLITPHIYGGVGNETDFAIELIKSSFDRLADYGPVELEIHTEGPKDPDSIDYKSRLESSIKNIQI